MSSIRIEKYLFAEKGASEGLKKSILETLIKVHAQAVALCPVDKGQLRNSYMVSYDGSDRLFNSAGGEPADKKLTVRSSEFTGYVGTNSDHWYPEFGTRFQVAQPHLRPAGYIAKGASVKSVMAKYGRDKMLEEFNKRKTVVTVKEVK